MNREELDILKELSEQTYFGDLPFLYYADLIDKLLTAYEKEKEERERIGKLYYEANENCIKYEKMIKKEKEKNKSLEQENSFLKMLYRGTDEFKAIEKLAKEE